MRPAISRILIADDHQAMRRGVRSLLEQHPAYQVIAEAGDGRGALDLAHEGKPDIAILDYSLPLMNGLELTRSIKHDLPRTEVLIYTMHDRESILIDVLRAGARGYVLKSDSGANLIAAVASLAEHKPYFSGAISETLLEHFIESAHVSDKSVMLTAREREMVQLIAEGRLNKQIAHMLNISVKTVETHRSAAMHKLKLKSIAELVLYAARNNIIEP